MACTTPSTRPHCSATAVADGVEVLGHGDVELEDVDVGAELAGRARRQAEAPPGAGEDDRGALGLGDPGDGEGQRGVGEDAGDHDVLAVEETHDRGR